MKVKVEISLKDGVLDPQAKTIFHALESLGFDCVNGIIMKKTIILDIDTDNKDIALQKAREMSEILLANVVIETYDIEVLS